MREKLSFCRRCPGHCGTTCERIASNKAFRNPKHMNSTGGAEAAWVHVESQNGSTRVIAAPNCDLRPGVVSITRPCGDHAEDDDYERQGGSVNLIAPLPSHREASNVMPRMTAAPVLFMPTEQNIRLAR